MPSWSTSATPPCATGTASSPAPWSSSATNWSGASTPGQPPCPEATGHDLRVVVICNEGYASSLAVASLHQLGLHRATDLVGGFQAWKAAGLPVTFS